MTPDEFQSAAIAILRTSVGWQTKIARTLDKQPRTVRRWLAGDTPIPEDVAAHLTKLMGGIDNGAVWPRGEWLVGRDDGGRVMVYHMQAPRFIARVVYCDEDGSPLPEDAPADVISGIVYVIDGSDPEGDVILCEIDWIDTPAPGEVVQLLEAAADAYEAWEVNSSTRNAEA